MRGKGGKCGCWCRKILHVRGLGFYNMKNKGLNRNKILLLVWVLLVYSSSRIFRRLRPSLAPVGIVAETRHRMGCDSFPRLAHGRGERPRKSENSWATSIFTSKIKHRKLLHKPLPIH